MTLDGGYDALFLVENDMILPEDALEQLAALDTDVAYGLYVSRHGYNRWLCYTFINEMGGDSLSVNMDRAKSLWGTAFDSSGVGMGCTLIHRRVLEKQAFRYDPTETVADDWLFSLDCIENGFRQTHDLGVVCGHIANPKSPRILWPNPEADGGVEVEFFDKAQLREVKGANITIPITGFDTQSIWGTVN